MIDHASVRAFVALEIPEAMRDGIVRLTEDLRGQVPGVRWLSPETIHLTLRFLGDSTPAQIDALRPALAEAAATCPATEIRVRGVGTFPDRGSPRVLWLGTELPGPILTLQRACEEAALGCGFPPEDKPFRSHITLGRWRDRAPRPELPEKDLGAAFLQWLVLYKSELRPGGAVHSPLARFSLT